MINVLYFAAIKDLTMTSSQSISVPANLQYKDFIKYLVSVQPKLADEGASSLLNTCACAVNLEYVYLDEDESLFQNGDEVALIPPVSGG